MKNIMARIKNILTTGSAIKVIIVLLLCYQLYDYTSQYLEYKTVVRMELKPFVGGQMPSLTLCSKDHEWMFVEKKRINHIDRRGRIQHLLRYEFIHLNDGFKSRNEHYESSWTLDLSYSSIHNESHLPVFEDNDYYNSMTDLILSNISSYKCMTLFSKLKIRKQYRKNNETKRVNFQMKIELPRLYLMFRKIGNLRFYFKIHSPDSIISSIPWENYLINNRLYHYDMRSMTRHLLPPPYDTNCYDYDQDLMHGNINEYEITRQSCKLEKFQLKLVSSGIREEGTLIYLDRRYHDEHFYHLPALNMIDYVNSIRVAFVIWIGISVWSFSVGFLNKLASLVKNSLLLKWSIAGSKVIIYSILLMFSIIGIYQSSIHYSSYEYIARIKPDVKLTFPTIEMISIDAVNQTYNFLNTSFSVEKKPVDKFLKHLFNSFKISCQIITNNDIQTSRDCGSYDDGDDGPTYSVKMNENHISIILFPRKKKDKNKSFYSDYNSKPIMIIKCSFDRKLIDSVVLHLNHQFLFQHAVSAMISRTFSFTHQSINLLPQPYQTKCVKYEYEHTNSRLACLYNCLNQTLFARFQCKLVSKAEKSISGYSTDWCHDKFQFNSTRYDKMYPIFLRNCNQVCSLECESNIYEYKLISKSEIASNESIIKIFPSEKPYIKYIYSPKMDFDELINQIQWIIRLWLGISVLSLINSLFVLWERIISSKIVGDFCRDFTKRNKVDIMETEKTIKKRSSIDSNLVSFILSNIDKSKMIRKDIRRKSM